MSSNNQKPLISAKFPFESKYLEILGSQMHYIDVGSGDPIVFLHGNPTSSYLWRNIIPHVQDQGRVIAPDLIGMGKSDKPDIPYRFHDHYQYLEAFLEALELTDITLVLHDWGSGLGFHYARLHEDKIKALVFMEAIYKPLEWSDIPGVFRILFRIMRTPGLGWMFVTLFNQFVLTMLPQAIHRKLTKEEKAHYKQPYKSLSSRKPVRQWPLEVPIAGKPADVTQIVSEYHQWLQETELPKLLLYAKPAGLIPEKSAEWIVEHFPNTKSRFIGDGIHFLQEDHPHHIGSEIKTWIENNFT